MQTGTQDGFAMDEECGHFWPLSIFANNWPDEPIPPAESVVNLRGVDGVILEPSCGTAIGVYRLRNKHETSTFKIHDLMSSRNEAASGQVEEVHQRAAKSVSYQTKKAPVVGVGGNAGKAASSGSLFQAAPLTSRPADSDGDSDDALASSFFEAALGRPAMSKKKK